MLSIKCLYVPALEALLVSSLEFESDNFVGEVGDIDGVAGVFVVDGFDRGLKSEKKYHHRTLTCNNQKRAPIRKTPTRAIRISDKYWQIRVLHQIFDIKIMTNL